jgi:hypothetical protein
VLGAFAWERCRDRFDWVEAGDGPPPDPHCGWYWSWGGLDAGTRAEIAGLLA